jgi:hypothetical protein
VRADNFAGGVIFRIADDRNTPSALGNYITLGNGISRVVGTLGLNVRSNFANDRAHVELRKNHHRIHVGQRGDNFGALIFRHHRPPCALKRVHRFVGIDSYYKLSAQRLRSSQVAHVPDMQEIESAVRQRDVLAHGSPFLNAPA